MERIRDLLAKNEKVWIHLQSDRETRDFMVRAKAEGFRWLNGEEIKAGDRGHMIEIRRDCTMGRVSMYLWGMAHQGDRGGARTPVCADYECCSLGEEGA